MSEQGKLPLSEYPLGSKRLDPSPAGVGTNFELVDLVRACKAAGFIVGRGLVNAIAVSCAEDSAHVIDAKYTNTDGSIDRGPFQFNSRWHAEVTDACAYTLACSAVEAYRVSAKGTDWTPWSSFNNGAYKVHIEAAWTALGLVDSNDRNKALTAQNTKLMESAADCASKLATANFSLDAARAQYEDCIAQNAAMHDKLTQIAAIAGG